MKKMICALIALILLPMWACAEGNLLVNGGFEDVSGDLPDGWDTEVWYTDTGVSRLTVESDGYEGNCVHVVNNSDNDARFTQTVKVEPDTLYRISCMCKAEGVGESGMGATLSIKDTFTYSEALTDTHGEWVELNLYGRTGADQTELTLYARVGGYGMLATGSAWFDNLEMVEVSSVPLNYEICDFEKPFKGESSSSAVKDDVAPARNTEMFVLLTCVYLLVVLAFARKGRRAVEGAAAHYRNLLLLTLAAALVLRAALAVTVRGYNTDINCFTSWSEHMAKVGPLKFYNTDVWCDYPPLYMLMLAPVAMLRSVFGLSTSSAAYLLLLKLWPILFDLAGALLLWTLAKKRFSPRGALLLAAFYALNPAVFIDSAAWGQIDSIFTLMIAVCALEAADERYLPSLLCFTAAVLTKPQSLLFAPLGVFAIAVFCIRRSKKPLFTTLMTTFAAIAAVSLYLTWILRPEYAGTAVGTVFTALSVLLALVCAGFAVWFVVCALRSDSGTLRGLLWGLLASVGVLYLCGLIFGFDAELGFVGNLVHPVLWLKELYLGTMTGYSYVSVNALNLYWLMDMNWAKTAAHPNATTVAWILFAASYIYCFILCAKAKKRRNLPLIGGLLIALIFTFGPMIHERYLYPALLLLAVGYVSARDRRLLASMAIMSACLCLNEILVLQGGMTAANYGHLQSSETWINDIVSAVSLLNTLYLAVYVIPSICLKGETKPLADCKPETLTLGQRELRVESDHRLHLKRIDVLLMALITLAYSAVAFVNLGVTEAPQTSWVSWQTGDSVTFDLGDVTRFRMTYYGGICNTNFTVELSNDGENWTEPYYGLYKQGEIFRWIWYKPMTADNNAVTAETVPTTDGSAFVAFSGYAGEAFPFQTARYVRIASTAAGLTLSEFGFLDEDGKPQPVSIAEAAHDGELLIDEQNTVAAYPSYLNSTYFDEIYHARTAYEHLHGMNTYEWTHPPLGKVLMMVGIQLFGMTPFGWRFMGTLMGVLMLPLMYLLVKQLTKSTKMSFTAMFLLAVDSMHFTQTRIATIDSYAVFWIMLMYLFMFRYSQMKWTTAREWRRSLVTLGLCGITMGIAWATKWIGLYASAGLAILFFRKLVLQFLAWRADDTDSEFKRGFVKRAILTLLFCVVFFIVIPALIYYFSYYWHLQSKGVTCLTDMFSEKYVKIVVDLQKSIYGYHAGLGNDTHYFRSPWYQWPIIWWPMWYYSGTTYMPSGVISSISCMGNPAVWWFGLIALLYVAVSAARSRRVHVSYSFVLIGFASQFLPWVLVPRSTFIYHYFASVPFIIMASVLLLRRLADGNGETETERERLYWLLAGILMGVALLLFIAFYPLESGTPVARSYAQLLRWFKWYNF